MAAANAEMARRTRVAVAIVQMKPVKGRYEENLRSGGRIGGPGGVAARENEHMLFGVDGYAGRLAQVQIGRKLQEIGNRFIGNLGNL